MQSRPRRTGFLPKIFDDTVPGSRGADDNATGIAVLLALARGIAEQPP